MKIDAPHNHRESMAEGLHIRRRHKRSTPMSRRSLSAALASGTAPPAPFPGIDLRDPSSDRATVVSGSLAVLLHGGALLALILLAYLAPEIEEKLIPVALIREQPKKKEPAPAPKALAERSSRNFAPAAQAVRPQVLNPQVVAQAVPVVQAQKVQLDSVSQVVAPKAVERAAIAAQTVSAVNSIAAARRAERVTDASAPALRGPAVVQAPVGPSVGPKQITSVGGTIGTGEVTLQAGSSVREGIDSNRDVLGSADGQRLANVNTRIGEGHLRGSGGGNGSGGGGISFEECMLLPAVSNYRETVKNRMVARWVLPPDVPADQEVALRFVLDVAGSASGIALVEARDPRLGASAVDALRSAAPFPPMNDEVRCLAGIPLIGTFRNPVGTL